uniref:uncharacterized protein LOC120339593 n=1 Tax=Styela clava TaxID=7725 RepID=UPI00193AAF06|nr:uncharacterized protein LOC120339593 [Styela clava]
MADQDQPQEGANVNIIAAPSLSAPQVALQRDIVEPQLQAQADRASSKKKRKKKKKNKKKKEIPSLPALLPAAAQAELQHNVAAPQHQVKDDAASPEAKRKKKPISVSLAAPSLSAPQVALQRDIVEPQLQAQADRASSKKKRKKKKKNKKKKEIPSLPALLPAAAQAELQHNVAAPQHQVKDDAASPEAKRKKKAISFSLAAPSLSAPQIALQQDAVELPDQAQVDRASSKKKRRKKKKNRRKKEISSLSAPPPAPLAGIQHDATAPQHQEQDDAESAEKEMKKRGISSILDASSPDFPISSPPTHQPLPVAATAFDPVYKGDPPSPGSATYLKAKKSAKVNVDIDSSNIYMDAGKATLTKAKVATTIFHAPVNINIEHTATPPTAEQQHQVQNDAPSAESKKKKKEISYSSGEHTTEFIDHFYERTANKTKVNITENYRAQKLNEPDFEVNPQLREVPDFYRGEMAPKVTEYNIEPGFSVKKSEEKYGELISLDELVEQLRSKKYRYTAMIGQAGSGKTTMTKRLAGRLQIADKAPADEKLKPERRFEFFHHLEIKNIPIFNGTTEDDKISPHELLFGKIEPVLAEPAVEGGYEWMQENQSKCILFLDGLDQATWSLIEKKHNKMRYTDKSSTATIMYNLITGHLFPKMTIVISSREHRIARLPLELRPQFMTALAGLNLDDVKRLFIAVLGDTGEKAWEKLTMQSPALIAFSSVPLFLIYNAIVCKFNPEKLADTMTEVVLEILRIFTRSDHIHEFKQKKDKQIQQILCNLMKMSFDGTKEKRVIFTIHDLEKVKLESREVNSIIINVPGKSMFNQRLMEIDHLMFFSHQVIQEILSALYISNMDSTMFRNFVETEIEGDHWAVVRRLLSGIILNPDIESKLITNFSPDARQDEKRRILKEFLEYQSYGYMKPYQNMELYGTLYEANDTDLIQSYHQIKRIIEFTDISFTTAGMHLMSSVMRRCKQLVMVCLAKCDLNAELAHILQSNLEGSCLKIDYLDVSVNKDLGPAGWAEVGLVVTQCQVKKFKAQECNLTREEMKAFRENTCNAKLDKLDVSNNHCMFCGPPTDFLGEVGIVITQCQVKTFKAVRCDLTTEAMKELKENTRKAKLDKLDVSDNLDLELDGEVGLFVKQCHVKTLKVENCNLTAKRMKAFRKKTSKSKSDKLDVSGNYWFRPDVIGELGLVVTQRQVKKFKANSCNLTAEGMKAFKKNTLGAKLEELDVSDNKCLGPDGFGDLGVVVTQCQVKVFKARDCNLTAEGMKAFKKNTPNAKIECLDLRFKEVNKLGDEVLSTIIEIVRQCQVQTLKIEFWKFNSYKLQRLYELRADTGVRII